MTSQVSKWPIVLIAAGTVCGLAATDLILPAIPILPEQVPGSPESAQWVLAAFALGTGLGLLLYGELGARLSIARLLITSLFAFALLSIAVTFAETLIEMSVIRFFQGVSASAPAVFAPVMIRSLYSPEKAVAMLGVIGSIESLAPAVAPIIGLVLLNVYGWQSSFFLIAFVAVSLGIAWLVMPNVRTAFGRIDSARAGYGSLLRKPLFMRYACSQAFTLGALLVIVFGAPRVITHSLGGQLSDFVTMQVIGITFFIISANMSGVFTRWWGDEQTLRIGSAVSALGCLCIFGLDFFEGDVIPGLWFFFIFVNLGLGIRGPTGFYKAMEASGDNDSHGSALVILFVMLTVAIGTAVIAAVIDIGLWPLAGLASLVSTGSVLVLLSIGVPKPVG